MDHPILEQPILEIVCEFWIVPIFLDWMRNLEICAEGAKCVTCGLLPDFFRCGHASCETPPASVATTVSFGIFQVLGRIYE